MEFKQIDFKSIGLVPQSVNGVLDMPKRKGESEYDWGDNTDALVDAQDIYFGDRNIVVDALFDERLGIDWKTCSDTLKDITTTETLSTEYGDYQVKLERLKVVKNYRGGKTIKLQFIELNPDLSGGLPTTTGSTSVRIDGYDLFVQFGLLIEQTVMYEISELKKSQETTFKTNILSRFRKPQELNVKLNGIYASKADMTTKINALNKLLAKEGFRFFVYHGEGFYCYIDDGFKVDIKHNRVEINLKLKVSIMVNYDEIVQEVINQIELQARPQSDLNETDDTLASFVQGRDTFVAADSAMLGGQAPAFYAQESEILAARTADVTLNTDF